MKNENFVWRRSVLPVALFLPLIGAAALSPPFANAQKHPKDNPTRDDERITANTDLVAFNVSVTDAAGRAVSGLSKNSFSVYDNGELREIQFFSDEDAPASVAVVFDTSGSMNEGKIVKAKEALRRFIRTSKDGDEFFLIDFNSRPRLLLNGTRDENAVWQKFSYVEPDGNTAFYDAVYFCVENVLRGTRRREIVLVISDGEDNDSRYTFKELRRRLAETDVIVYAVGFGGYFPLKGGLNGRDVLEELASVTGGKAFFPKGAVETDEAFERIALEMRRFSSVGFYPPDFATDGKKHRLKVKLNLPAGSPRLLVRHREIYYAGIKP